MKCTIRLPEGLQPQMFINRCGYATFRDPNTGETSYVRRLGAYFYPRFHLYLQKLEGRELFFTLHLDMKQPTYIPGRAHSGEYEGPQVEQEVQRIRLMAMTRR